MRIYWIRIMIEKTKPIYRGFGVAAILIVFGLLAMPVRASHHLIIEADPVFSDSAFEIHTHGRFFYALDDFSGLVEYVGRFEDEKLEYRYQSLTLGGYYRLHSNIKIGAFYRLKLDVQHDNDWIEVGPDWLWAETSAREEHAALIDVTPRILLPFLPGENWVGSIKTRYEYNFTNFQQTLLIRPGITYFWTRDREPVINITVQYAAYLSLNYGAVPWYRHGPYLSVLYHLNPNILLDVGISRQWIYWSESEQFLRDFPGQNYRDNIYSPWIVDAGFIIRLP
jgi:hypothetical protein